MWDYHIVWEAQIYTRTVHKDNHTPLEALIGDTTDISEWIGLGRHTILEVLYVIIY